MNAGEQRSYSCVEVGGWVEGGERHKKKKARDQPNPPIRPPTKSTHPNPSLPDEFLVAALHGLVQAPFPPLGRLQARVGPRAHEQLHHPSVAVIGSHIERAPAPCIRLVEERGRGIGRRGGGRGKKAFCCCCGLPPPPPGTAAAVPAEQGLDGLVLPLPGRREEWGEPPGIGLKGVRAPVEEEGDEDGAAHEAAHQVQGRLAFPVVFFGGGGGGVGGVRWERVGEWMETHHLLCLCVLMGRGGGLKK